MLAPILLDCETDLAKTWNLLLGISGFCQACLTADVAQIDPPVSWVPEVQQILTDCRSMVQDWFTVRESLLPSLSGAFVQYENLVAAAVASTGSTQDAAVWSDVLSTMRDAASANSMTLRQVSAQMSRQQTNFQQAYNRLRQVRETASETMAAEQADIATVEVKLQELYDHLQTLGVAISASDMAAGKEVVQTVADIAYDVLVAGEAEVPYLTIITVLYTVGSSVYDLVATDAEIASLLGEVAEAMKRLSGDARVLAMTGALIASLDSLLETYASALQWMPRLNSYWDGETGKIDELVQALRQGPVAGLTDIAGLNVALTVWQQLSKVAGAMVNPVQESPKPVPLTISLPEAIPADSN